MFEEDRHRIASECLAKMNQHKKLSEISLKGSTAGLEGPTKSLRGASLEERGPLTSYGLIDSLSY